MFGRAVERSVASWTSRNWLFKICQLQSQIMFLNVWWQIGNSKETFHRPVTGVLVCFIWSGTSPLRIPIRLKHRGWCMSRCNVQSRAQSLLVLNSHGSNFRGTFCHWNATCGLMLASVSNIKCSKRNYWTRMCHDERRKPLFCNMAFLFLHGVQKGT